MVSALLGMAVVLASWTALSVVSVPVLVLLFRSQSRVNGRISAQIRREEWSSATVGG